MSSNYVTIQNGDNLWNIAKSRMPRTASNTDIANAVSKLALANDIKDQNAINAGAELNVSIFNAYNENAKRVNAVTSPFERPYNSEDMFQRFENADIKFTSDHFKAKDKNAFASSKENFKFTPNGYMGLPQDQKTEVYKESILELAKGEIEKYDMDKSGALDIDEFSTEQLSRYIAAAKAAGEDVSDTESLKTQVMPAIQSAFDTLNIKNSDDVLDVEELATNYAFMDGGNPTIHNENGKEVPGINVAYDEKFKPVKDANGAQVYGMDGRIMKADTPIAPEEGVLQMYYDNFFAK